MLPLSRTLAANRMRSGDGESCSSSSLSYSDADDADDEESQEASISDELTQVCFALYRLIDLSFS